MIKWDELSKDEFILIDKITKRAFREMPSVNLGVSMFELTADISGAHLDTPLKLRELLEAGPGDFAHDIAGIYNNFNRESCKLENGFCPRLAEPNPPPRTFEQAGRRAGLRETQINEFCEYMRRRWPNKEGVDHSYIQTWAERFKAGNEYIYSDLSGQRILDQIRAEEAGEAAGQKYMESLHP